MIFESLTKTGGCCGSGESCCGDEQKTNKKPDDNEGDKK